MSPEAADRGPGREARQRLRKLFGDRGRVTVASAPGRVNLVGEHTDYNDGFVLPMAIGRRVAAAIRPRADRTVRVHATLASETRTFDASSLAPGDDLPGEAYNERRASCERAVELLAPELPGVRVLRDVSPSELEAHRSLLDPTTYRRARHVVEESLRPRALARCLEEGDPEGAGAIMDASHASLRDLYEVSSPELDAFVEAAREDPHCFGARMTGAGFGGCAVALVARRRAGGVAAVALERYRRRTGRKDGAAFAVGAGPGARVETVPSPEIRGRGDNRSAPS